MICKYLQILGYLGSDRYISAWIARDAGIGIHGYPDVQVHKFSDTKIWAYSNCEVFRYTSKGICKYVDTQMQKYKHIQICDSKEEEKGQDCGGEGER